MGEAYRFPGVKTFSDAALASGKVRPDFAGKVTGEWFVARAVDALSQLERVPASSAPAVLAQAEDALAALRACADTVEAALAHARPFFPEAFPQPEASPERPKRRR